LGDDIAIALDPAASEFFDKAKNKYVFKKSDKSERSPEEMVRYWSDWRGNILSFRSKMDWQKMIGTDGS